MFHQLLNLLLDPRLALVHATFLTRATAQPSGPTTWTMISRSPIWPPPMSGAPRPPMAQC